MVLSGRLRIDHSNRSSPHLFLKSIKVLLASLHVSLMKRNLSEEEILTTPQAILNGLAVIGLAIASMPYSSIMTIAHANYTILVVI